MKVSTESFQIKALRTALPCSEREGRPFPRRSCLLVAKLCCLFSAKRQHIFTGKMPAGNPDLKKKNFPSISPTAVIFFSYCKMLIKARLHQNHCQASATGRCFFFKLHQRKKIQHPTRSLQRETEAYPCLCPVLGEPKSNVKAMC